MMRDCLVGLSLMPDDAFRRAAEPLFAEGSVDCVEWSFDTCWDAPLPAWLEEQLREFSANHRLLGHGVRFSPLSAEWGPRDDDWLERMNREYARRDCLHLSEHFGFCRGGDFHHSAPLPVPLTGATLRCGQDRLRRLADAIQRPIGLENLAFAFTRSDVEQQGEFIDRLLDPIGGFLLLDLHNVYCQALNFGIDAERLLDSYPLHRVREVHVSGGSFSEPREIAGAAPVRRDTHDGPVPEALFELLPVSLAACPNVRWVILERLGHSLTDEMAAEWRDEFHRLKSIVRDAGPAERGNGADAPHVLEAFDDAGLPQQVAALQSELLNCLATDEPLADRLTTIAAHPAMQPFPEYINDFEPRMLEVAAELVRKWGRRGRGGLTDFWKSPLASPRLPESPSAPSDL